MAINALEYAKIFQQKLDEQMITGASSGWMEANAGQVKYNGGDEVKIPQLTMDGLGDYDRDNGFVQGSVTLTYGTYKLTQDRSRTFQLDSMDVDETNFVATAGNAMGQFQRTKVIPEVDAYRYSKIAALAITASKKTEYTPAADTILAKLRDDIAAIQDIVGEAEQLVITMAVPVSVILDSSPDIVKKLDVTEFTQGGVNLKVKSLDGAPIRLRAGSYLLKALKLLTGLSLSGAARSRYRRLTRSAFLRRTSTRRRMPGNWITANIMICGFLTTSWMVLG
jgi:hypothetical protein